MKKIIILLLVISGIQLLNAQNPITQKITQAPVIEKGLAQRIKAFEDPSSWIRQDLWVETEFDSDGDGKLDRMHTAVTRPAQTDEGIKLPVIYESSPYFAGTAELDIKYFCKTELLCVRVNHLYQENFTK